MEGIQNDRKITLGKKFVSKKKKNVFPSHAAEEKAGAGKKELWGGKKR